jgi:hypothetical protein
MRITLTTLTIAFLFALIGTIISPTYWTFGDFIVSFIMTFGFIIIPLFICVCVFHLVLNIYKRTERQPSLIIQILILWLIYNLFLCLVGLPDFLRHENTPGYVPYKSFAEYFMTNILEGFIIATIFSVSIPVLDKFFKNKIFKLKKEASEAV